MLQCDIRKYFPSIDHEILKELIAKKIKCKRTLDLINKIIDGSNEQEQVTNYFAGDDLLTTNRRKGLPIGNLTSQFFANMYLNEFDHFILEKLKISKYLRYVDDFALFSDDKEVLENARKEIEEYLEKLRLKIHPIKSQLFETKHGGTFLGFRVFPDRIRVKSDNLKKGRKRIRKMRIECEKGLITEAELMRSLQSWFAHLEHGDTWILQREICEQFLSCNISQKYPLLDDILF